MNPTTTTPRPVRASTLGRLTLAYAATFVAISALFFAGAMHLVAEKNRERLQSLVSADSRDLTEKLNDAPPSVRFEVARAIVGARIARGKDRVQYALIGPDSDWFGNLNAASIGKSRDGSARLKTRGWLSVGAVARVDVGPDAYVLIGRSQDDAGLERDVMAVGLLALALAALVAFVIGPMASVRLVRRVEAVNQACETFGAGDMTARAPGAAAPDEFGALARSVNAMFERIDDLVGGLRDVSNRAAHDLRTPIARLKTELDTIRTASTLASAHAGAEAAVAETNAILATFDALLDIAEIEAGSTLTMQPVDLAKMAHQATDLYRPVAEDAGVTLMLTTELAVISGEPSLLVRLIANLLDNAIKYSPKGSRVAVTVHTDGPFAVLTVEDDGPGIPPDRRAAVLGRAVRGADSTTPGLGLGLALVAAVVRRHDADLTLATGHSGCGLRVESRFPLQA